MRKWALLLVLACMPVAAQASAEKADTQRLVEVTTESAYKRAETCFLLSKLYFIGYENRLKDMDSDVLVREGVIERDSLPHENIKKGHAMQSVSEKDVDEFFSTCLRKQDIEF